MQPPTEKPSVRLINSRRRVKRRLKLVFNKTYRFFRRKIPQSEHYPYDLVDPIQVDTNLNGYEAFYLVGDNWLNTGLHKEPIALMIGFNDWKFGFMSDYLKGYRCVFVPRHFQGLRLLRFTSKMKVRPKKVFVWGAGNIGLFANLLLKIFHFDIIRVEDGFIRSSELGAKHTTPYSLVFDDSGGIYFNPRTPSKLEMLFNEHDFSTTPDIFVEAEKSIELINTLQLSKYNPAALSTEYHPAHSRSRKRVAIMGQVDSDMSMKYGNVDKWTTLEVVQLAKLENVSAEIVYRPHPEVFAGIQKNRLVQRNLEKYCTIVSPTVPLTQFLDTIDHVYVVTSLSGIEALIKRKKVTVLGIPFYAGWGLTDDRANIPRRKRQLSLEELFACTYLLYPKYLGNLDNPYIGLTASCFRIFADNRIATQELHRTAAGVEDNQPGLEEIAGSKFWATLVFLNKPKANKSLDKNLDRMKMFKIFEIPHGEIFQNAILYSVYGALQTEGTKERFLKEVREYIEPEVFNRFVNSVHKAGDRINSSLNVAWLLGNSGNIDDAVELLETEVAISHEELQQIRQQIEDENVDGNAVEIPTSPTKAEIKVCNFLLEQYFLNKEFDKALEVVYFLLLNGFVQTGYLLKLIQLSESKFDRLSARSLSYLLMNVNAEGHNNAGINYALENIPTEITPAGNLEILKLMAMQLVLNPDRVNRSLAHFNEYLGRNHVTSIAKAILNMSAERTLRKATAYLELNEPKKALKLAEILLKDMETNTEATVIYATSLSLLGRMETAIQLMREVAHNTGSPKAYIELLRLLKSCGRFEEALSWVERADRHNAKLTSEGHIFPIYHGLKRIEDGFRCFLESAMKDKLIAYFGEEKYLQEDDLDTSNLLLICSFGPAEEIRFGSFFNEVYKRYNPKGFKMTCDTRLHPILKRSFPKIDFVPVGRSREFGPLFPRENYNQLPGPDLRNALDNNGLTAVEESKKIVLFTEIIRHFRKEYKDFPGTPYLKDDAKRTKEFRKNLPQNTLLVGLNWRSRLTNATRNVHYLTVEQLEPIFKLDGITFVNLQYDECDAELEWINGRYPGKIIDFPGLDQFNDFDGVASLMMNLDLVVAPCTAVIELAGALGRPGLFFTNHAEIWWRQIGPEKQDVWYNCVRHVRGSLGDKNSLVERLKNDLSDFVSSTE